MIPKGLIEIGNKWLGGISIRMKLRNKDVILVPILIIAGKLTSFVFHALLGAYYGAGKISDAFIMAQTIPTILFDGVATALISCYIPIQRTLKHESPEKIDDFNSNMTNISFLLSLVITTVYFVFREKINRFYGNGFDTASLLLLNNYTAVLMWSIPFIGAYAIFRAHLQVSEKKTISSLGQIVTYFLTIIALVVFWPNDISLSWATLFGNVLCFVLFLTFSIKTGYRYRPYLSLKESYIKTLLLMIFPIFFSTLASEFASIVDKYFASQYSDGVVTSLTYGYQLSFALQGIVSTSLLVVVFPALADKAASKDEQGMNRLLYVCADIICWIILPLLIGGVIVARPLIGLLFGHGNFSNESVQITSKIFGGYLIGVLPMCLKHVGDRTCFALKKTNYAMVSTFTTVGTNIVLDYLMSRIWGYMGLVIATDISILLGSVVSYILIKREDKALSYRRLFNSFGRPLICAIIMGGAVFCLSHFVLTGTVGDFAKVMIDIVLGMLIYVGAGLILFKKEISILIGYFHKTSK